MPAAPFVEPNAVLSRLEGLGIKLGLERARDLLAGLGDPQLAYPTVLVAGSNGKGSTSALLAAMATAAGYRTGLYTSPHLETVEECLRIDGWPIPTERLGALLARLIPVAERETGTPPTSFEALTAAAFLWFAEEKVGLGVTEVGLGGRLDATNLCDPLLSIVTSISLEHQEFLGDTLDAIARQKAGTFRSGRPALAWVEDPEPAAALRDIAVSLGTDLRFAPDLVHVESAATEVWTGQRVRLATPVRAYDLRIHLLGEHQRKNLALAVLAAEILGEKVFPRLDAAAITAGAAACRWAGRLEVFDLPLGRHLILDAAHNAEGVAALAAFLATLDRPVDILFGVLADKAVAEMLALLAPHTRNLVLTTPPNPRAKDPAEVAALLGDGPGVIVEPDPERALERLLELGGEVAVVCGSIYLIGELRGRVR
ncbi:MAG TPA: Mur ligase family protein [Thermoanaerobaculia bacterium]|nr:Mur ligase family protein [Thermoanaerobaculia bacterium]